MPRLPEKSYFKIGEVARIVGVKPHVVRYWESEFRELQPSKSHSGQRIYERRHVELVLLIQHLLHEEKLSVEGAKKQLRDLSRRRRRASTFFDNEEAPRLVLMRSDEFRRWSAPASESPEDGTSASFRKRTVEEDQGEIEALRKTIRRLERDNETAKQVMMTRVEEARRTLRELLRDVEDV